MKRIATLTATALFVSTIVYANTQPYAGQQTRDIASLSADDIDALSRGEGWGFAKSAELNGYPGPAHILELADELELSTDQRAAIQDIFDRMNVRARALGADYIAAEAALDAAFSDRAVTPETVVTLTREAGRLRGDLRAVHLAAHLEAAPLLSRHQTMLYNKARGYDAPGNGHSGHDHN